MGKDNRPWYAGGRDEDGDEELINQLGQASRSGPPPGGNDHGRKPQDSCMVTLLAMAGGAVAFAVALGEAISRLT